MKKFINKNNLNLFSLHLGLFIFGTLVYLLLLKIGIFGNIAVYFYRGIVVLFFVLFLICLIITLINKSRFKEYFTTKDAILSLIIIFSFNILFFTHIPVTADRSVTVFLLSNMAESSGKAFSEPEIEEEFIERYVFDNKNIQKRLDEQVTSGNIILKDDGYVITDQGLKLVRFYISMVKLLNIDDTNLNP